MKNANILLSERLREIGCDRLPAWVFPRLLPLIDVEVADVNAKANQQIQRRVARVVTTKTVAAAFVAGPLASAEREGRQGEDASPLLGPTVTSAKGAPASCAVGDVVGHSHSATQGGD